MMPADALEQICRRPAGTEFNADDVAELVNGALGHAPNGKNSATGAAFQNFHKRGRIEPTGRFVRSRQPHRKGGAIEIWRVVGDDEGTLL